MEVMNDQEIKTLLLSNNLIISPNDTKNRYKALFLLDSKNKLRLDSEHSKIYQQNFMELYLMSSDKARKLGLSLDPYDRAISTDPGYKVPSDIICSFNSDEPQSPIFKIINLSTVIGPMGEVKIACCNSDCDFIVSDISINEPKFNQIAIVSELAGQFGIGPKIFGYSYDPNSKTGSIVMERMYGLVDLVYDESKFLSLFYDDEDEVYYIEFELDELEKYIDEIKLLLYKFNKIGFLHNDLSLENIGYIINDGVIELRLLDFEFIGFQPDPDHPEFEDSGKVINLSYNPDVDIEVKFGTDGNFNFITVNNPDQAYKVLSLIQNGLEGGPIEVKKNNTYYWSLDTDGESISFLMIIDPVNSSLSYYYHPNGTTKEQGLDISNPIAKKYRLKKIIAIDILTGKTETQ